MRIIGFFLAKRRRVMFLVFILITLIANYYYFGMNKVQPRSRNMENMTHVERWFPDVDIETWGRRYPDPRVWCCLMASPILEDFVVVNETWGKYCTRLTFFVNRKFLNSSSPEWSSFTNYGEVVDVALHRPEGDISLWETVQNIMLYANKHRDEFDWLIKADTDAWFSPPNFKLFAQYFNPSLPWYMGHVLLHLWEPTHNENSQNTVFVGGGLYALSRKAVCKIARIFSTKEFKNPINPKKCHILCSDCYSVDGEDYLLGNCLRSVGIIPVNVLNDKNQTRFCLYDYPQVTANQWTHLMKHPEWFMNIHKIPGLAPGDFIDENMISFHWYKNRTVKRKELDFLTNKYTLNSPYNNFDSLTEAEARKYIPTLEPFRYNLLDNEGRSTLKLDKWLNSLPLNPIQKVWRGADNLWQYETPECN